jgi:hypothetical protein
VPARFARKNSKRIRAYAQKANVADRQLTGEANHHVQASKLYRYVVRIVNDDEGIDTDAHFVVIPN